MLFAMLFKEMDKLIKLASDTGNFSYEIICNYYTYI